MMNAKWDSLADESCHGHTTRKSTTYRAILRVCANRKKHFVAAEVGREQFNSLQTANNEPTPRFYCLRFVGV